MTYHVVPGKIMAADVKPGKVKTAEGASASIRVSSGAPMIDKARIVKTDIECSNGVIHVIDSVLMPGK